MMGLLQSDRPPRRPAIARVLGLPSIQLIFVVVLLGVRPVGAQQIGRASCAAATCHGGVVDRGPSWNFSLTKWLAEDPHAGAGLLLRDDDARAMVTALDAAASGSQQAYDQVLRRRCIGCHTTATPEQCESNQILADTFLAQGVSCEACHGLAGNWLEPHVGTAWSGEQRFSPTVGMRDTESIIGRTVTCIQCHVGSRSEYGSSRDMNHDLIAAGHPVLRFDLLIYNENLPHHWSSQSAAQQQFNESAVRVRRASRARTLAAAAQLSAQRAAASQRDPSVPWPELSDYDCFACHQSLSISEYRLPADRQNANQSPLRISDGLPIWNSWHTIGQKELSKRNLQALAPNQISPASMERAGKTVAEQYALKADTEIRSPPDPQAELERLRNLCKSSPPRDWHEAAIQYLDVDAVLRDLGRSASPLRDGVEPLLRFDRGPEQQAFESPAKFDAVEFQQAILQVLSRLPTGKVAEEEASDASSLSLLPGFSQAPFRHWDVGLFRRPESSAGQIRTLTKLP